MTRLWGVAFLVFVACSAAAALDAPQTITIDVDDAAAVDASSEQPSASDRPKAELAVSTVEVDTSGGAQAASGGGGGYGVQPSRTDMCDPSICNSPCVGFSNPSIECGGCGEDVMCNPSAKDFELGFKALNTTLLSEQYKAAQTRSVDATDAWETARTAALELDLDALSEEAAEALLQRLQGLEQNVRHAEAEFHRLLHEYEVAVGALAGVAPRRSKSAEQNRADVEAAQLELDASIADGLLLPPHELCPLQRVAAGPLRALSPTARALLFLREPTIVEGLIDHWSAITELADPEGLRRHLGSVELNEDRVRMREEGITTVGQMDMGASHLIAFSNWDTPEARQFDAGLAPFFDLPDIFAHRTSCYIYSVGGLMRGAMMAHHGWSWVGITAGAKRWYVAPPTLPQPREPACRPRGHPDEIEGVSACLHRQGEVLVLTESWWHATCNVDPFTIGIGGQDNQNQMAPPHLPRLDPVLGAWGEDPANNPSKSVSWEQNPRVSPEDRGVDDEQMEFE